MKITAALLTLTILASCGADGAPVTPTVSGKSTVGVNSNSGVFTQNSLTVGLEL